MERVERGWACSSLNYDYDKSEWYFKMRQHDGSEDWMYDVEVYIDGEWRKLNEIRGSSSVENIK